MADSMQRHWVSLSMRDSAVHTNVRLLWVCLYACEGVSTWGREIVGVREVQAGDKSD